MTDLFDLPVDEPEPRAARRVLTVAELTTAIREILETTYPEVWVEGELSNCRLWNTGHLYFTLKDESAQLKAVMFRSAVRYLKFRPENGLHVIARGRVSVYDPKGEYQIVCEHLQPHGLGALQLAFEQLKQRLHAEGLFDPARKRQLPALPRKIGVVTSLDGAALRDIIKVLRRRYPNAHLVIRPARVQGEGAAEDLARGIAQIATVPGIDVAIVGRGGGSTEDLWAFNEEVVARAIARSPIPVISAVGHEIDYTISDFVADVRAATPSAAAELVVARKDEYGDRIDRVRGRLEAAARTGIHTLKTRVHVLERRPGLAGWPARLALRGRHAAELTHELARAVHALVAQRERRFHTLQLQLDVHDLGRLLASLRARLVAAHGRLAGAITRRRHETDVRLRTLAGRLETLSPLAVLGRGYAVCWNDDRTVIVRDAAAVSTGQTVRVTLHRGELSCEVKSKGSSELSTRGPDHGSHNQGL